MIKGILLDLDNTLYEYEKIHVAALNSVCDFMKNNYNREDFLNYFKDAKTYTHKSLKNTASSHNRILYFQKALELMDIKNILLAKELYDIYWNYFLNNFELYDGVIEFFESNKDKHICLVTDLTAYIQYRKIKKLGIDKYIQYIVTSEEAGVEKPNSRMFELALEKLNLTVDEVCMIGDSYEKDILGAKKLGIKSYWKTEKINDETEIFNDFNELIGKI